MKAGSEEALLAAITKRDVGDRRVVTGIGDDCAVVRTKDRNLWQLLKTDAVVEGVHFERGTPAEAIGWKAMMRPLSDFAAMSGVPEFALVTLALARQTEVGWAGSLYAGLRRAGRKFEVAIVGGETTSTSGAAVVAVTVSGYVEPERCVWRNQGRPGDDLFVTGSLGGAMRGKHLRFTPRLREARWLTEHFQAHAMMDLSDGLAKDLPRLARASGCSFALERALPRARGCSEGAAMGDGEDYELLFALSPRDREALARSWKKRWSLRLTRIGKLTQGGQLPVLPGGYDHFASRR